MANAFIGKFSMEHPEQIQELFYAGGEKGSSWYGEIKEGDYIFPVYNGEINALWKFKGFGNKENSINRDITNVALFEEVHKYENQVKLIAEFARYKYFNLDLNLLNKSCKSVKGLGFIPISIKEGCQDIKQIDFNKNFINLYISLDNAKVKYNEGDIRILVSSDENHKIIDIEQYWNGNFSRYDILHNLYIEKNKEDERYTIKELLEYSNKDGAKNKRIFLTKVIEALKEDGYFKSPDPIKLYDNLIVGRKKSSPSKSKSKESLEVEYDSQEDFQEDESEISQYNEYAKILKFNPNIILYGPPGTGKTYSTQKIIEAFEKRFNNGKNVKFKDLEDRVSFITFHQSYSYEEFIEGIRPEIENESSSIKYKIEDGVLKKLSNAASKQYLKTRNNKSSIEKIMDSSRIWKVSLGKKNIEEEVYKECKENKEIAVGWFEDIDLSNKNYNKLYNELKLSRTDEINPINDASTLDILVNEMNEGDIVLIYDGPTSIRDIGIIESPYYFKTSDNGYNHRRTVTWIKEFKKPIDIFKYNGGKRLTLKSIYELSRLNITDIKEMITENEVPENQEIEVDLIKPYYLVIDEINRGNISKIFGELITLIEKDKRNNLSCILPYSQKAFTIPENLYIIGTMNTSDRSIALIDTALRRRFAFIEIEPNSNILKDPNSSGVTIVNDNVDLCKLMDSINKIITKEIDRDHRIGHSYFMDILNLDDLYYTWYYKILPLLTEYFYNDSKALSAIVGNKFYDNYGNLEFLMKSTSNEDGISEFERALIDIYNKES